MSTDLRSDRGQLRRDLGLDARDLGLDDGNRCRDLDGSRHSL